MATTVSQDWNSTLTTSIEMRPAEARSFSAPNGDGASVTRHSDDAFEISNTGGHRFTIRVNPTASIEKLQELEESVLSERNELLHLEFTSQIDKRDAKRLAFLEWQLDRIDEKQLDVQSLDRIVQGQRELTLEIGKFISSLKATHR